MYIKKKQIEYRPLINYKLNDENVLQLHSSLDAITFLPSQTIIAADSDNVSDVQAVFYTPNFSGFFLLNIKIFLFFFLKENA